MERNIYYHSSIIDNDYLEVILNYELNIRKWAISLRFKTTRNRRKKALAAKSKTVLNLLPMMLWIERDRKVVNLTSEQVNFYLKKQVCNKLEESTLLKIYPLHEGFSRNGI